MHVHHWQAPAPPHVPPRRWAPRWRCRSWTPWCPPGGRRASAAAAADPHAADLHRGSARPGRLQRLVGASKYLFAPETDGPRLHAGRRTTRCQHARAVPRLHDDRQQHRRAHGRGVRRAGNRRRPLPLERGVPDAVASEADAGLGHLGRHVARSDVREALRAGDADAVDAVLHREPRPGRRLHLQLLVRLHRLDQLGVAERAAADDPRPARRVRHAVRRRRHAGGRARRAARPRSSILDWINGEVATRAQAARRRPTARASTATSTNVREIERRIQAVEARNTQRRARASCRTRRPACPIRSPST